MKLLTSVLLLTFIVTCRAEKGSTDTCSLTGDNLNFFTPTSDNIANIFWQEDVDGYESLNRLHIVYKNGSVAVVEHKYCSMYNFEIAYYAREKSEFSDVPQLKKLLEELLGYAAIKDARTQAAISVMVKQLENKGFDADSALATAHDDSTQDNKRAEYSLSYLPIEGSSLHNAALFIYIGIGGEH